MTLKAILFDHDGTLADSETQHHRLWQEVLRPYGLELSPQVYREFLSGIPTDVNARDLVARYGLPATPQTLARLKNEAVQAWLAQQPFPLMPGARSAIERCHRSGLVLAVVSGSNRHSVDRTLHGHGLAPYFREVVTVEDVQHGKPAPDAYLLALHRLGLKASECLAVEDTRHGIEAAVQAGLRCCGIPNAMSEGQDFSRATRVFGHLDEVCRWIEELAAA